MGQNDKYLISKLKAYNVTPEKIDQYLKKLNSDNVSINPSVVSAIAQ